MKIFTSFILIQILFLTLPVFGGERKHLDDRVLVEESQLILTGQILSVSDASEMLKNSQARLAKIWVFEVLKGNLSPAQEIEVLFKRPIGKDGSIALLQHKTYLLFLNSRKGNDKLYEMSFTNHGAVRMHFEETDILIGVAGRIKKLKEIINVKQ